MPTPYIRDQKNRQAAQDAADRARYQHQQEQANLLQNGNPNPSAATLGGIKGASSRSGANEPSIANTTFSKSIVESQIEKSLSDITRINQLSTAPLPQKPLEGIVSENEKLARLLDLSKKVKREVEDTNGLQFQHKNLPLLDPITKPGYESHDEHCDDCDGENPCSECLEEKPTEAPKDEEAIKAKRKKLLIWGGGILTGLILLIVLVVSFKKPK